MQDILGSMRRRAGDLMDDVSSEVERQRQLRRLEKEIETVEREIQAQTYRIGEQVIEQHRQGRLSMPTLEDPCQQVLEAESRLSELNRQKVSLQEAPEAEKDLCPDCGGELPDEGEFCHHCGARFGSGVPTTALCDNCGAEVIPGAVFCGECGQRLDNVPAAAVEPPVIQIDDQQAPPEERQEPLQPAVELEVAPAGGPQCTHCQAPLEPDAQFCGNCGWLIEGLDEPEVDVGSALEGAVLEEDLAPEIEVAEGQSGDTIADEVPAVEDTMGTTVESDFLEKEPPEETLPLTEEAAEEAPVQSEATAAIEEPAMAEPVEPFVEEVAASEDEEETFPETVEPEDTGEIPTVITGEEPAAVDEDEPPVTAGPVITAGGQTCANCGGALRSGATFCPTCGEQVTPPPAGDDQPVRVHCGVILEAGMRFCPECGEEVPFVETPVEVAPVEKPADRFCPVCGATVRAEARFCPDCGQPVSEF